MHFRITSYYSSIGLALAAAAFFGASTPLAKVLLGDLPPQLLAGLLYLGSGVGLFVFRLARDRGWQKVNLTRTETGWLAGAIVLGGIVAPVLLMAGLTQTTASAASLLLNLETVLTALLAWMVFHEYAARRVVLGMLFIVGGGVVLAWRSGQSGGGAFGMICVAGACLCWAVDNNFTRKVSASDTLFLAASKGLIAGVVNTSIAMWLGTAVPSWGTISFAMLVGIVGYGVSLVLFIRALRTLGAARTGAYFAIAPFVGALAAVFVFREAAQPTLWLACALMLCGVVLHITEHHAHLHAHLAASHDHAHSHDDHHRHSHEFPWDGREPHTHPHPHEPLEHSHVHFPDIHHQHRH